MIPVLDDPAIDWFEPGVYEVSPGVWRVPLPLPGNDRLKAINAYVIAEDDGFVLVDSGWFSLDAKETLARALEALGGGLSDIRRFMITHSHVDHYTLARVLSDELGAEVWLGRADGANLRSLADPHRRPLLRQLAGLRQCGAGELADRIESVPEKPLDALWWRDPDRWLDAVDDLGLTSRTLAAIHTPGHSQGHMVFHDPDARLMFTGDEVLPRITPSIGFEAAATDHALDDFLTSLRRLRALPDARLLPAHGAVGPSVHQRVDELLRHHEERLDAAEQGVDGQRTAFDVAQQLTWTRHESPLSALNDFNQMLAILETVAHLDVLVRTDRLKIEVIDGTRIYSRPEQ